MMIAIYIMGTAVVLAGDFVAAKAAKRLNVSYLWYTPFSLALYVGLGGVAAYLLDVRSAVVIGAAVGYVDSTAGSLIADRVGVMGWERRPARSVLLLLAAPVALVCALFAYAGAALLGVLSISNAR
jgi:hypothetical protein